MTGIYLNIDCMEGMADFPDNYFDLAIVDPPYGIGMGSVSSIGKRKNQRTFTTYIPKMWDSFKPDKSYFTELKRVSKNQIIWGANYFTQHIGASSAWIFWDKGFSPDFSFSAGELAYTSFDGSLRRCKINIETNNVSTNAELAKQYLRIHPTQKPKALYRWLMQNYWKEGQRILDSHVGSGNSLAVFEEFGAEYVGYEIDKEYYDDSLVNIARHVQYFKARNENDIIKSGGQKSIFDSQ